MDQLDICLILIEKAEHWKIDAFELWCWRRLMRVPWTARRSNQSILKEISPGYSLEGLMLKLKLQYFGHLMRRVDLLEKTLMLGGIGGRRRRGQQRMRWFDCIMDSMDMGLSRLPMSWWWTGRSAMLRFMGLQTVGHDWVTKLNWTELNWEWGSGIMLLSQVKKYFWPKFWIACSNSQEKPQIKLKYLTCYNVLALCILFLHFQL